MITRKYDLDIGATIYVLDNGKMHRPNNYALITDCGFRIWYLYGIEHRYYGPSDDYGNWYMYGELIKTENPLPIVGG